MTIALNPDGAIALQGDCPSGDAEILLRRLLERPDAGVDWRACDGAHGAVIQVLLASRSVPQGPPRGAFLREMVEPVLKA